MADEQRNVAINFQFKRSGDTDALNSFKKIQQTIEANKATAASLKQVFADVRAEIKGLDDNAGKEFVTNIDKAKQAAAQTQLEFAALRGEIKGAAEEADKLGTATQKSAAGAKADGGGGGGGGGSANIGTIGRGLSGIGFGDAGQLLNTADDLKDIYEQFKNIGGVSETVATGTQAAAAGYAATAVAILPIAAIAVAGALAMKVLTDTIAAQKKAVDDVVAGLEADTSQRLLNIEIIKSASSEQIKNTLEVQKAQLAQVQADKASRQAFYDANVKRYNESSDLIERAGIAQANLVAATSIDNLKIREDALTKSIDNNTNNILPAIEAREKESKAIEQATENAKNFVSELKRYSDLQQQLKEASAAVTTAEKDRQQTIQKRAQDDLRAAQISQLESKIENAKAAEEAQARKDRITALRAESGQAETEVAAKTQKSITDTNQKYMEQQLKSLNRYLLAEQRATENYNVNRVRKLEDLYANLSELAAKGDVAAFVTTRRTGLRDVKRGDEDFGTGAQQRLQDYQNERRDALQARNQQLADARAAGQAELTDRKAQIDEKIKLEQKAGEQQLSQSQQLQQQLANLRQQFSRDDLDARRRSEDEAYRVQIGKLRERQNAITQTLTNTFNPAVSSIYNLGTSVINFINRIKQAAAAPVQSLTGSAGGDLKKGKNYITAFATGTPKVPVSGVYHLDEGEAVLNQREAAAYRANRLPGFASAGRSMVVNVNAVFGEITTPSQMRQQINEVVAGVQLAVNGGSTA